MLNSSFVFSILHLFSRLNYCYFFFTVLYYSLSTKASCCSCCSFFSLDDYPVIYCIKMITCWYSVFTGNKQTENSQMWSKPQKIHHFWESVDSVSTPGLTLTVWITRVLWRFTGSTRMWDNYVFSSGRGLIQYDWIRLSDTACVCVCDLSGVSVDDRGQWHCLFLAGQELTERTNGWNKGLRKRPAAFISRSSLLSHKHNMHEQTQTHLCTHILAVCEQNSLDH